MPTNLTDRLGELVDKVTPGPCVPDGGDGYGAINGYRVRCDTEPGYIIAVAIGDVADLAKQAEANAEYTALCFTHKDEILSALRKAEEADTAIERLTAREAELCEALRPFARQKTIEEIMAGEEPAPEWVHATPERRIELMGERKRENTANILRARLSLGDEK